MNVRHGWYVRNGYVLIQKIEFRNQILELDRHPEQSEESIGKGGSELVDDNSVKET